MKLLMRESGVVHSSGVTMSDKSIDRGEDPRVVTELWVYPIKSGRGVRVESAVAEAKGFRGDRRWMVVDERGVFLSQRTHARMALISALPQGDVMSIAGPGGGSIEVPVDPAGELCRVTIWDDAVDARDVGDVPARWLSAFLGVPVRLVFMPEQSLRPLRREITGRGDQASFADAYPYLLIGQNSLHSLNTHLADPVPMDRFRPNIVVGGCGPYEEDTWRRIRIGGILFYVVKPCTRCVVTTVDQGRGLRGGDEPLATLWRIRRTDNGVIFGQNCVAGGEGEIRVGDRVEVIETGPPPSIRPGGTA